MQKYIITGNRPLQGKVCIGGSKNSALGIIPASALSGDVCRIENISKISDVTLWLEILQNIGAQIRMINKTTVEIDSRGVQNMQTSYDAMRQMRASYYLISVMLGRFGHAEVAMPGGCDIGVRSIDQHIKGFEALGATVEIKNGLVIADAPNGLNGSNVYLDGASVGATINIMIAATQADGQTVIENPAKEPHVVDIANFLNTMGADIKGAGTDMIKIRGRTPMHGCNYTIIPDQIEAGTYMALAAATRGDITVTNVIPKHLECISAKLEEIGLQVEELDDAVRVRYRGELNKANIKTLPYPGFPTDMQPQIASVLCMAAGTSLITEGVFDNRFRYVDELKRMGAHIQVDGRVAVVEGVGKLSGAAVRACDLRAGAALIIAGLAAQGITEVEGIAHITRGYEDVVEKLRGVGADINCVEVENPAAIREAL